MDTIIIITLLLFNVRNVKLIQQDDHTDLSTVYGANIRDIGQLAKIRNYQRQAQTTIVQNCPWSCNCLTRELVICLGDKLQSIPKLPIGTKHLVINNGHLEELHDDIFQNIHTERLYDLDLRNNSIKFISSQSLDGLYNVQKLSLSGNLMTTLPHFIFANLKSVIFLDLSNNRLRQFPRIALCSLKNLQQLNIGYNSQINVTFEHQCFNLLTSVSNLTLDGNQMANIGKYSFTGLRKSLVSSLYLKNSNISLLSTDVFKYVRNLTRLDLAFNLLQNLHVETFQVLHYLQSLSLQGNRFHQFDFNVLLPAMSLNELIIGNKDMKFDNMSFKPLVDLVNLKYLTLDTGKLTHIRVTTFSSFQNNMSLKELRILNCKLHTIEEGSFKHFHHLNKLIISNTSYFSSGIREILFDLDSDLVYFSLNYNYKMTLNSQSFRSLKRPESLEILDLSASHVTGFIPLKALEALPNLRTLNLSKNYVVDVDVGQLPILKQVQLLDLSHNAIQLVRQEFLCSFPNVGYLDLSYNTITLVMFKPNMTCVGNIKNLLLQSNKIGCIQYLNWFTNLEKLNLNDNELKSLTGNEFLGLYNLRYLHLEENYLWQLPTNSFKDLRKLIFLSLDHNYIFAINAITFEPLSNLKTLSINNNHLDLLNVTAIKKLKSLKELRLSMNDLICDCQFRPFYEYVKIRGIFMPLLSTTLRTICLTTKGEVLNLIDFHLTERECQPMIQVDVISSVFLAACIIMFLISVVYRFRWYIRYKQYLLRSKLSGYRETVSNRTYQHDAFVSFCEMDCEWVMDTLVEHVENNQDIRYGMVY